MAGVAGKAGKGAPETEFDTSGVRNSMWLVALSTNGLYWRNQRYSVTVEVSGIQGMMEGLTAKTLAGAEWVGMVASYKI